MEVKEIHLASIKTDMFAFFHIILNWSTWQDEVHSRQVNSYGDISWKKKDSIVINYNNLNVFVCKNWLIIGKNRML